MASFAGGMPGASKIGQSIDTRGDRFHYDRSGNSKKVKYFRGIGENADPSVSFYGEENAMSELIDAIVERRRQYHHHNALQHL